MKDLPGGRPPPLFSTRAPSHLFKDEGREYCNEYGGLQLTVSCEKGLSSHNMVGVPARIRLG